MNLLYIDANIFLGFYNSNKPEFKKLLSSISELTNRIFFTSQLGFEIDRNKLNVFKLSIENYLRQSNLTSTFLPEHLDEVGSTKLAEWNKARKNVEKSITASNSELASILNEIMINISRSEDSVSKALSGLYSNSYIYSENDFEKARFRKEIGNPPGKKDDPLGDQFSWELLLNIMPKVKCLWIVTKDMDYFTEYNNELFLNPVLYKDLKKANPDLEIKSYNILSGALRDFDKHEKIQSIPTKEELDVISRAEVKGLSTILKTGVSVSNQLDSSFKPNKCPNCNAENSFTNGGYIRSQYGGLTFQYICKNCGFHFDTGEFFD